MLGMFLRSLSPTFGRMTVDSRDGLVEVRFRLDPAGVGDGSMVSAAMSSKRMPERPPTNTTNRADSRLATALLRLARRQAFATRPTGRAWIGLISEPAAEILGESIRSGISARRFLGHRLQADRLQVAWDAGRSAAGAASARRAEPGEGSSAVAAEGQLAGQQLVEDHAQAVDVAAAVDLWASPPACSGDM